LQYSLPVRQGLSGGSPSHPRHLKNEKKYLEPPTCLLLLTIFITAPLSLEISFFTFLSLIVPIIAITFLGTTIESGKFRRLSILKELSGATLRPVLDPFSFSIDMTNHDLNLQSPIQGGNGFLKFQPRGPYQLDTVAQHNDFPSRTLGSKGLPKLCV